MRERLPSWLTTRGPRWSSFTLELPELRSSLFVSAEEEDGASGRASGVDVDGDVEFGGSFLFSGVLDGSVMVEVGW